MDSKVEVVEVSYVRIPLPQCDYSTQTVFAKRL